MCGSSLPRSSHLAPPCLGCIARAHVSPAASLIQSSLFVPVPGMPAEKKRTTSVAMRSDAAVPGHPRGACAHGLEPSHSRIAESSLFHVISLSAFARPGLKAHGSSNTAGSLLAPAREMAHAGQREQGGA